jgi:hypothetical protein
MTVPVVLGHLSLALPQDALDAAYRKEGRWPQAFRVSADSRLVLLGLSRLLASALISAAELREAALIAACRAGALDCYESFDDSLLRAQPSPLTFAYALPSIGLAAASICHGVTGPTYTLAGDAQVGLRGLEQAALLLRGRQAERVVLCAFDVPTTGGICKGVFAVLGLGLAGDRGNAADAIAKAALARANPAFTCPAALLEAALGAQAASSPMVPA